MQDSLLERITINPNICHGKPCIREMRYPVEFILELLSSGMTNEEILEDYDDLELDDIRATLLYAAKLSQLKNSTCLFSSRLPNAGGCDSKRPSARFSICLLMVRSVLCDAELFIQIPKGSGVK